VKYLINIDGTPFELKGVSERLDQLEERERREYRDKNASAIAKSDVRKMLIVSGPGTGKSYLFLDRIEEWLKNIPDASVFVTSFVRKLVADLENTIDKDEKLTKEQKRQITVWTLHKFARSIVEKNHGTSEWPFQPYLKIIGQTWEKMVWCDVLRCNPKFDKSEYSWECFKEQLYKNSFMKAEKWQQLKQTYFELCSFYNTAGFGDLIIRARVALEENHELNNDTFFIIDEFQDFNQAEAALIKKLVRNAKGILVVGDDEQVLYERLKFGEAKLIREAYKNRRIVNAMLPFCSRSGYHIVKCADHFIKQNHCSENIEKVFLPIDPDRNTPKVKVIACPTPSSAVDYIEKFVHENKVCIDERKAKLSEDEEQDAYLLILTPSKKLKFYKYYDAKSRLKLLVNRYKTEKRRLSDDYYKVMSYCSLAENPKQNFSFRKILFYENVSEEKVHNFTVEAMRDSRNFCDLGYDEVIKILEKCRIVKNIVEEQISADEKVNRLSAHISVTEQSGLKADFREQAIGGEQTEELDQEEAEIEGAEIKKMCAVELMTIVGSKGLTADHVIIIGFDDVNMKWITPNAFYVAMTRAKKSLHILTALKAGGAKKAPSFLYQLPEVHTEYYQHKKSGRLTKTLDSRECFVSYLAKIRG